LILAVLFIAYVMLRCWINPSLAPVSDDEGVKIARPWLNLVVTVAPLVLIFAVVVVSMIEGWATPTESSALGALGTIILALCYRALTPQNLWKSFIGTISISGALLFGMNLFDSSGQRGIRRVIDVSGDGANNSGQIVTIARDEVLSKGITINGLPVMLKRPSYSTMDIEQLDEYYEDCVIGGPAAFVVPVKDREKFVEAIRTKLVQEIASLPRDAKVIQASAANPRVPCTVGERIWQERWGN